MALAAFMRRAAVTPACFRRHRFAAATLTRGRVINESLAVATSWKHTPARVKPTGKVTFGIGGAVRTA